MAPATIKPIPSAIRRSKFSRKTNHASSAVKTPSAFNNSDAPDAGMFASPHINRAGPIMPPETIAPINQPRSLKVSLAGSARCSSRSAASPSPDPR